jgi:DNA-binding helix-hairpin-helix protein with protein kinase domain
MLGVQMHCTGSTSKKVYQSAGELARAGEGVVYFLKQHPTKLLKIFDQPPLHEAIAKLELLTNWPNRPTTIAFPIETVADVATNQEVGFIQPYFTNASPLTRMLDNASRRSLGLPNDLAYRVKLCRLLAEAFALLHSIHLVMGDVSDSNFLMGRDWLGRVTTAYIIDCNSFQVTVRTNKGNECYLSGVATEEYAAPEVQPTDWSKSLRSIHSDSFGFAVLAWKLLFNGAHPFSVVTQRSIDVPPLGQRIEKRQFPFHPGTPLPAGWTPPPLDPSLAILPSEVRDRFFSAFSKEDPRDRPLLDDWRECLHDWEKALTPSLPVQLLVRLQDKMVPKFQWPSMSWKAPSMSRWIVVAVILVLWFLLTNFFMGSTPTGTVPHQQIKPHRTGTTEKPQRNPSPIDPELFPHFPWNPPPAKE